MRILILTTQDKFFLSHVKERALYFKRRGCIVAVAAQKTSDQSVGVIKSLGFDFYDTKIERKSLNPIFEIIALVRLREIFVNFKPDVSYQLGSKAIFYGTFIFKSINSEAKILNAPIGLGFVYASPTLKARLLKPLVSLFYRLFLNPKNSRVIVENLDDINFFIQDNCLNPKDAYCIMGAGVDTNQYFPLPFYQRNPVCTVVMASRLIREKGVLDFIKAAERLYKKGVPVKMQLVGKPDFGNPSTITQYELEKISQNKAIEYLGFQEDMVTILQNAHICCLPSYYREGLPRILLEGASSGLAIITTDTIGCKEAVRDQNGFLFKPHDVDQLCDLIEYMVTNPKELEQMAKNSRRVAVTYFDSKLISERTFDVLTSFGRSDSNGEKN